MIQIMVSGRVRVMAYVPGLCLSAIVLQTHSVQFNVRIRLTLTTCE